MANRNSPKGTRTSAPKDDILTNLIEERINKTVTLDPPIIERIDEIAGKLRTSFSSAAGLLIQQALDTREATNSGGTNILNFTELPPYLLTGIKEVSKLTGLDFKAVIVQILGTYLRETLSKARNQSHEMEAELKSDGRPRS